MILTAGSLFAEDRINGYQQLLKSGDYAKLRIYLNDWESEAADDPELLIAWFNYYMNLDAVSNVGTFRDPWTGQFVLAPHMSYDQDNLAKAVAFLDRGIEIAPRRLDMHFGRLRVLAEMYEYERQGELLTSLLQTSLDIGHRWLWSRGLPVEDMGNDPLDMLLYSSQDYVHLWTNSGNESAMASLLKYARREQQLYPDYVLGYSNHALYYLEEGNYADALPILLEAYERFPGDHIIIHNLGNCYGELGMKTEARAYYEKLYEMPGKLDREYVDKLIEELEEL